MKWLVKDDVRLVITECDLQELKCRPLVQDVRRVISLIHLTQKRNNLLHDIWLGCVAMKQRKLNNNNSLHLNRGTRISWNFKLTKQVGWDEACLHVYIHIWGWLYHLWNYTRKHKRLKVLFCENKETNEKKHKTAGR